MARSAAWAVAVQLFACDSTRYHLPVAAECEIDACGVQALGRCAKCRRAFCMSHQAVGEYGLAMSNQCTDCRYEQERPHLEAVALRRRRIQWLESGGARTALIQSGKGTVPIYDIEYQDVRFRRERRQVYHECGRAWVIGIFMWSHDDHHEYSPSITMIAADPKLNNCRYGVALGHHYPENDPRIVCGGGSPVYSEVESEEALLDAIVRLAGTAAPAGVR